MVNSIQFWDDAGTNKILFHTDDKIAFSPDCCCGDDCTPVFEDTFERDDSTSLGSDWTEPEVSGDWEIDTNQLTVASSGAIVTSTQSRNTPFVFDVTATPDTDARPRAIVDYTDASNYIFVEVHYTTVFKTIFLYEKAAGVDTLLAYSGHIADTETSYTIRVCVKEDEVVAKIIGISESEIWVETTVTSDTIGVGAGNANEPKFDSVLLTPHADEDSDCPSCDTNCSRFTDYFDRDDDTDLDDGWTEDSGNWTIASDRLTVSTAGAVATAALKLEVPFVVTAECTPESTAEPRVIVDYTDASNYVYVAVEVWDDSKSIFLYERIAGTDVLRSYRGHVADTSTTFSIRVCVENTSVRAAIVGLTNSEVEADIAVASEVFGVGSGTSSEPRFTEFTATLHVSDDATCPACAGLGCTLATDVFNEASETDLGSAWDERSGSWTMTGSKLSAAATSLAVCSVSKALPQVVSVVLSLDNNEKGGIVVAYDDDDNYFYCEVNKHSLSEFVVRIFERVSGSDTEVAISVSPVVGTLVTTCTLTVCVGTDFIAAKVAAGTKTMVASYLDGTHTDTVVGLKVSSGTVEFENFSVEKHNNEDALCAQCGYCVLCDDPDLAPDTVEVTISGMLYYHYSQCPYCPELNQTFYLDFHSYSASYCRWRGETGYDGQSCGGYIWMYVQSFGAQIGITIGFGNSTGGANEWIVVVDSPTTDCDGWDNVELTTQWPGGGWFCDVWTTPATCFLSTV